MIGADTVVLTHAQPVSSDIAYSELPVVRQELLEKPVNKADNLRMLQDLNGSVCEVVTGVSLGERHLRPCEYFLADFVSSHSVSSDNITWVQYTVGCPLGRFFTL